jgi:methionyl-tRNA formyltransferase
VTKIIALNNISKPIKKVLILGYDKSQTRIITTLIDNKCQVYYTNDKYTNDKHTNTECTNAKNTEAKLEDAGDFDFVVSFGYRHILTKRLIDQLACPIFNLHISYLPYNRGAHPNFWSFFDNTPAGVTIHLIDAGIDTGPIVYQRYVNFSDQEVTFAQTHARLVHEVESLFEEKLINLLSDKWKSIPQRGKGTVHSLRDLPAQFSGWDAKIDEELKRLEILGIR